MMTDKLPKHIPKYMFNTGFVAGNHLFNLDKISADVEDVILVEGVFDVWGMQRNGYHNVVGSFGKHLTDMGIRHLVRRFKRVLVMWDEDAIEEIVALANRLDGMIGVSVTFLKGKDPDEAKPEDVKEAVDKQQIFSRSVRLRVLLQRK